MKELPIFEQLHLATAELLAGDLLKIARVKTKSPRTVAMALAKALGEAILEAGPLDQAQLRLQLLIVVADTRMQQLLRRRLMEQAGVAPVDSGRAA